jgi:DNA-binding MarR family transcriptional regulator
MATGFDQHFADLGITQAQFRILLAVWEQGGAEGIAPSVLAHHLLIERGTISVLTNRMVERGWLARRPGENRRTFRLTLTQTGRQLLEKVIHSLSIWRITHLSGISPANWDKCGKPGIDRVQSARVHRMAILQNLRSRILYRMSGVST